jgi:hypothetical protein
VYTDSLELQHFRPDVRERLFDGSAGREIAAFCFDRHLRGRRKPFRI